MGIKSDALPQVTGFGSANSFIVNGPAGTGRMTGAEAVKFFDQFFPYALYHYEGVNIKEKFAGEMDYTDPWTWIKQRLEAQDVSGLHIKDFFEVTAGGNLLQMQIADLNHDLHFADQEITLPHIDFISKDLWPTAHQWNKANYNNGLKDEADPWLCSDLKAWLNSETASVPNATTANPDTASVDYTTTGVFDKLPVSLRDVIIERRALGPIRFNASQLLTDDIQWVWKNIGKLWIPNETEVFSQAIWGSRGWSVGETHQFPIFTDGKTRIKHLGAAGSRSDWWLRSAYSGNAAYAACVGAAGIAFFANASHTGICAPVCFRISG